jgi:hypothetical protein
MKKLWISVITLIVLAALLLAGCQGLGYTSGSGEIKTKQYDLRDFDSVDISNSFHFEILQSDSYNVSVSCRENIVPYLDIYKSGRRLSIGLKPGFHTNGDLNAEISLPDLNRLTVSGDSKGSARGFESSKELSLIVSGASQVDMDIEAGETAIELSGVSKLKGNLNARKTSLRISGVSTCELAGTAGDSDLEISGASTASLKDLQLGDVNINASGASTAIIRTDSTLNLDISGASNLEYYGNPTLSKVSVTGASKIKSKS